MTCGLLLPPLDSTSFIFLYYPLLILWTFIHLYFFLYFLHLGFNSRFDEGFLDLGFIFFLFLLLSQSKKGDRLADFGPPATATALAALSSGFDDVAVAPYTVGEGSILSKNFGYSNLKILEYSDLKIQQLLFGLLVL